MYVISREVHHIAMAHVRMDSFLFYYPYISTEQEPILLDLCRESRGDCDKSDSLRN